MTKPDRPQPKPWERQPHETPEAWQAFQTYRDIPPTEKRTAAAVRTRLGKSEQLYHRWMTRWDWRARAAAWDDELDAEYRREVRRGRAAIGRQQATYAAVVLGLGTKGLDKLEKDISKMKPRDVLEYVKVGLQVQAALYGLGDSADDAPQGVRIYLDPNVLPDGAVLPPNPED